MNKPAHPATRIGHVHLKVSDLDRALNFYAGVLGFRVMQRHGNHVAFISAGGNGVELCWDKPETVWPRDAQGGIAMYTRALDLDGLLITHS